MLAMASTAPTANTSPIQGWPVVSSRIFTRAASVPSNQPHGRAPMAATATRT